MNLSDGLRPSAVPQLVHDRAQSFPGVVTSPCPFVSFAAGRYGALTNQSRGERAVGSRKSGTGFSPGAAGALGSAGAVHAGAVRVVATVGGLAAVAVRPTGWRTGAVRVLTAALLGHLSHPQIVARRSREMAVLRRDSTMASAISTMTSVTPNDGYSTARAVAMTPIAMTAPRGCSTAGPHCCARQARGSGGTSLPPHHGGGGDAGQQAQAEDGWRGSG